MRAPKPLPTAVVPPSLQPKSCGGGCSRRDALSRLAGLVFTVVPAGALLQACQGDGGGGPLVLPGNDAAPAPPPSSTDGGAIGDLGVTFDGTTTDPDAGQPFIDGSTPQPDAATADPDAASVPPADAAPPPPPDAAPPPPDPDASAAFVCPDNAACVDLSDARNAAIARVGGSGFFDLGNDTVIVVQTARNVFTSVSAFCTHRGCQVEYDSGARGLYCPCHGARFALDGSVTQGPARTDLQSYRNEVRAGYLIIYLS